jgi:malonyl-CoA decarboxylase
MSNRPDVPAPRPRMRAFWDWLTRSRQTSAIRRTLSTGDLRRAQATLRDCLEGVGGEASALDRIASLATLYTGLNDEGRRTFFLMLVNEFGPDEQAVKTAIGAYLAADDPAEKRRAESDLRLTLASPRIRILRQFNLLPEGVKFLVDLRADLLRFLEQSPELELLDDELHSLFASWFDVGNLELRRISWQSPAMLLEKLIAYEAVHEIRSWNDLRNRLDSDHRCYAFFHPRMPEEPLIFVEIALTRDIAANIQALLDENAPPVEVHTAQAAIFYSISTTQAGLRGVSFGGFLIKRVVEQLSAEFPSLRIFTTLSPVPGFRKWLETRIKSRDATLFGKEEGAKLSRAAGVKDAYEALEFLLARDLAGDAASAGAVFALLCHLVARYLAKEKEQGRPVDPVARFHLGNGASLERINWLGDTSPHGMDQSVGLMVNYLYRIADIEANNEAYAREGDIAMSTAVKRLLRPPP